MRSGTVRVGSVLAGKFRVERVVGVGGMGMVVAAHHLALDQRVALKLMLPDKVADGLLVTRFLREARAAARLCGEHVTRVFDVGTLENGAPYIVMELLRGRDLGSILRREGPVSMATAATLVAQASQAVAEAHAAGIVHRDLKPSNLFVTRRRDGQPLVKVLDLGICTLADASSAGGGATNTDTVIGTPSYMAPEQMRSARLADARSDIWSLGVILHELVSGSVPFPGETYAELCVRTSLDPTPRLSSTQATTAFADLVARCLEKNPDARFQTVTELIVALAPHAGPVRLSLDDHEPARGVAPTVPDAGTVDPSTLTLRFVASAAHEGRTAARRWPRARVAAMGLVGVLLLVLLASVREPAIGTSVERHAPDRSVSGRFAEVPATSAPSDDTSTAAVLDVPDEAAIGPVRAAPALAGDVPPSPARPPRRRRVSSDAAGPATAEARQAAGTFDALATPD